MSAADDLRAALLAHAPLTALVGQRVRQDMADEGDEYPLVVFKQSRKESIRGLDGSLHARVDDFQVESWAETRAAAAELHDLVEEALIEADIECDPADPEALEPELGARACVWNVRMWDAQ